MNEKIRHLREKIKKLNLDGMIISNPVNIKYLCNIESEGTLLITRKENVFITYTMYIEDVKATLTINDEIIVVDTRDISKEDYDVFFLFCENVGFEENYVTYEQYKVLKQKFRINNLVETENLIEKQREVKDAEEIENIKKALDCKDQEIVKDTLRIIARNMYGATLLRGKKGIYQEISLAMAWWRFYLAKEISQNTNLDLEQIYKYFITQKSNYNELIMRMSGGLTIISNPYTRDALISFLLSQEKITGNKFKEIIKKIGIQSAWRLIGGLSFKDNLQIIKELSK